MPEVLLFDLRAVKVNYLRAAQLNVLRDKRGGRTPVVLLALPPLLR